MIVPTFNRASLLRRLLESILEARRPVALQIGVTIIDNNSSDNTAAVVEEFSLRAPGMLNYIFEPRPGKSFALNRGIDSTQSDLIGLVDDDEELRDDWFEVVAREFADPDIDFIGGICIANWEAAPPGWLPRGYDGILGIASLGDTPRPFSLNQPGILLGGNAAVRRSLLERVGPYATTLGRGPEGLGSCEDRDMYHRLLAAGGRGRYVPDMVIRHFVPAERMTKRYHRRWCYNHGKSLAILDREARQRVAYLIGMPRYMLGDALRGALKLIRHPLSGLGSESARFGEELHWWGIAGFLHGVHVGSRERK